MASFSVGKPIATSTPAIVVDAGLPVGSHRFQLEVVNVAGSRSKPHVAVVAVRKVTPIPPVPIPSPGPIVSPLPLALPPDAVAPNVVEPSSRAPNRRAKRSDSK